MRKGKLKMASFAIIGIRIEENQIFSKEEEVFLCGCDKAKRKHKFCPECGAQKSKVRTCQITEISEDLGETIEISEDLEAVDELFGFDFLGPAVSEELEDYYFLGLCHWKIQSNPMRCIKLTDETVKNLRETLRETLLPLGLWDEAQFGLWLV